MKEGKKIQKKAKDVRNETGIGWIRRENTSHGAVNIVQNRNNKKVGYSSMPFFHFAFIGVYSQGEHL